MAEYSQVFTVFVDAYCPSLVLYILLELYLMYILLYVFNLKTCVERIGKSINQSINQSASLQMSQSPRLFITMMDTSTVLVKCYVYLDTLLL